MASTEHEDWESWAQSGPHTHDAWRHTNNPCAVWPHDTEHERNEDMGDAADYYDPDGSIRHGMRSAGQRRNPRRPILPMEVAMAAMTPAGSERFGSEPPIGSVLRWTMTPNGHASLTYVAVRVTGGNWYCTGQPRGAMSWDQIVIKVGDNPCSVATGWTEIPAPEPEPQGDDVVAAWASQFRRAEPVTGPVGTPDDLGPERPEPRFDAEGRDRNGWTRAELGEDDDWSADAHEAKGPDGDGH